MHIQLPTVTKSVPGEIFSELVNNISQLLRPDFILHFFSFHKEHRNVYVVFICKTINLSFVIVLLGYQETEMTIY